MGIAGLKDILGGGLARNHLYLIEGDPGTGKTTIAMQFLTEGVRHGQKGLYVTLSESKAELLEIADSHGWMLDGIDLFELVVDEQQLKAETQYTVFSPSEIELADTTGAVLAEVERLQPTRVVIDSLSELRLLARDSLRYRRQVLGLKKYFSGRHAPRSFFTSRRRFLMPYSRSTLSSRMTPWAMLWSCRSCPSAVRSSNRSTVHLRFREGFHDYCIKRGGVEVYPRLVAAVHPMTFDPTQLKSGIQ